MQYNENSLSKKLSIAKEYASAAIKSRLLDWGFRCKRTSSLFTDEDGWLPKEVPLNLRYLIKRFYYYYGQKRISNMGLTGWECGLGQMLDLRDPVIASILPYLLTSYMYNFLGPTRYIRQFIADNNFPSNWNRSVDDDYFLGIKKSKNDSSSDNKSREVSKIYGIGKFFEGNLPDSYSNRKKLINDIAQLFFFPETKIALIESSRVCTANNTQVTIEKYVVPITYPSLKVKEYHKNYKKSATLKDDIDVIQESSYAVVLEKRDFSCADYENIFNCWYKVIKGNYYSKTTLNKTLLGCPPDAKICYMLLQKSLKNRPLSCIDQLTPEEIERQIYDDFTFSRP